MERISVAARSFSIHHGFSVPNCLYSEVGGFNLSQESFHSCITLLAFVNGTERTPHLIEYRNVWLNHLWSKMVEHSAFLLKDNNNYGNVIGFVGSACEWKHSLWQKFAIYLAVCGENKKCDSARPITDMIFRAVFFCIREKKNNLRSRWQKHLIIIMIFFYDTVACINSFFFTTFR